MGTMNISNETEAVASSASLCETVAPGNGAHLSGAKSVIHGYDTVYDPVSSIHWLRFFEMQLLFSKFSFKLGQTVNFSKFVFFFSLLSYERQMPHSAQKLENKHKTQQTLTMNAIHRIPAMEKLIKKKKSKKSEWKVLKSSVQLEYLPPFMSLLSYA